MSTQEKTMRELRGMNEPPTGIIRTLPKCYADPESEAYAGYTRSVAAIERDTLGNTHFYIALAQRPVHEVLHLYVLIAGKIELRFTLAGFRDVLPSAEVLCWDGTKMKGKQWAICTGPVSRAPEPIERRGFRGFRYTGDLW